VARVELIRQRDDASAGTRVVIEGGRMRDVKDAAHPRGTTIAARDLFFNTPARRKFLRSEATESYHLTNLVTHYALAHPEINFTLTNNGRETLRVAPAKDLRERAYQIFGAQFLDGLLEVNNAVSEPTETSFSLPQIAKVRGFVSAPRERRTSRDAQFLFVNGRFVRDRLIGRALSEGYRSILPHGVYPVALLFVDVPLEEVDCNVHPAKTEVRFRRVAAVADAVREAVRAALASGGYAPAADLKEPLTPPEAVPRDPVVNTPALPPLDSALKFVREVAVESVSSNIRPLGQLDESFIIATDDDGLLLIDQHVAHDRVLFDKYRGLESSRRAESQAMLIPETFDLTPAQASAFD